jgi:hypothetical protein
MSTDRQTGGVFPGMISGKPQLAERKDEEED